ncbi:MAG: septal ring lytic transglycosylase RlpA family protein [Alphaproteobacteria bacterium]|nr:septal ring lytic transglycosylase RlpA family protein [Alphaproteobacteria bacterium]
MRNRTILGPTAIIGAILCLVLLAGCTTPRTSSGGSGSRIAGLDTSPGNGRYKIGNPYQIEGVWYRPSVDYEYDEEGVASWYGPGFHGKSTANGEVFDTNLLSAAHRTLPMPSFARVTNNGNGRWVIVRINDRGPYVNTKNRIIDLSRRAAQLLGFIDKGTAAVRVQIMGRESKKLADYMRRQKAFLEPNPGSNTDEGLAALEREKLLGSPEARQVTAELYYTIAVAAVLEQVSPSQRSQTAFAKWTSLGTSLGLPAPPQ